MTRELVLWAGVVVGAVSTLFGLAAPAEPAAAPPPPEDAVAMVDGHAITAERYWTALAGLAAQDRAPALDRKTRQRVLDDLVAEELLLARGATLGLSRDDPAVRRALLQAMLDLIEEQSAQAEPTVEELRAWFDANPDQFTGRRRFGVRAMFFAGGDTTRPKQAASALAAGEPFADVSARLADAPVAPVPAGPLPARGLVTYLGPTAAKAVPRLEIGAWTQPIRGAGGWRIIKLQSRVETDRPVFDVVSSSVRSMVLRERRSGALERYILQLRSEAEVSVDDAALDPSAAIPAHFSDRVRVPSLEGGR